MELVTAPGMQWWAICDQMGRLYHARSMRSTTARDKFWELTYMYPPCTLYTNTQLQLIEQYILADCKNVCEPANFFGDRRLDVVVHTLMWICAKSVWCNSIVLSEQCMILRNLQWWSMIRHLKCCRLTINGSLQSTIHQSWPWCRMDASTINANLWFMTMHQKLIQAVS